MMWWDRLFEAKNKLWAVGWIGPGWARHGQQTTWVKPVEPVDNGLGLWLFEFK